MRLAKRHGAPDPWLEGLSWRIARFKNSWNFDITPLTKYLDDGTELVPITQTFTLNWLYMMERYIDWHEQGIPVLALRYEELNAHREEVLSQVFEYCDLPVTEVQKALEAFSEDAHEGTPIERARPDEEPFRLSEEQVDEVVRVLARHPVINTSDFLTPGMLKL